MMDVLQLSGSELYVTAFAFEIEDLATDEMATAGSDSQLADIGSYIVAARRRCLCEDLESDRKQGVPGEYGNAFAIFDMTCWHTPTQIIVIHARKIVVNERVSVDALHRGSGSERILVVTVTGFGGGQAKNRTQAFTAGEHAVSHRIMDRGRTSACRRKELAERLVDDLAAFREIGFQLLSHQLICGLASVVNEKC